MQPSPRYMLTIHGLFAITDSVLCGADAEVAILDGDVEIDRIKLSGKCQSKDGYSRAYIGKQGLTARLVSGSGRILFEKAEVTPVASVR